MKVNRMSNKTLGELVGSMVVVTGDRIVYAGPHLKPMRSCGCAPCRSKRMHKKFKGALPPIAQVLRAAAARLER